MDFVVDDVFQLPVDQTVRTVCRLSEHVMSCQCDLPAHYWTPFTFSQYDDDKNKIDSTEGDDADQQHSPGPVAERAKECLSEYHVVPSYK